MASFDDLGKIRKSAYILEKGMKAAGFDDKVSFLDEKARLMAADGELQLLPGQHDCDGFYISRYIKE